MPTTVVVTVGSSHTYTTGANYNTYINGVDLIGTDTIQEADFYNDSELTNAGNVLNIVTLGSTSTQFVILTTGPGQSFRDNANVRTTALYYNAANGVGINDTAAAAGAHCVVVATNDVKVSNLQFASSDNTSVFNPGSGASNTTVSNCIFVGPEMQSSGPGAVFNNCLFVNTLGPFNRGIAILANTTFNFCTFICNPSLAFYVYNDHAVTYNNCAFFGGGTTGFNVTTPVSDTFVNCMTDITGTTGLTGGKTFASQFTSTTNDFRTKAGADLINAGTPIGGITTDISGFTRSGSTPTIGAWEFGAGAATPTLIAFDIVY